MAEARRITISIAAGSDPAETIDSDESEMYSNPDYADGRDDHHGDGFDWPEQQCDKRRLGGGCVCKSLCDPTCMYCGEVVA